MATKRYQVAAACVLVPIEDITGPRLQTMYRGATFEADPENYRVKHNADSGYIVEIGRSDTVGVDAAGAVLVNEERPDGSEPGGPVEPEVTATPSLEGEQPAEGDATPPADGSAPAQADPKSAWVEYAVAQGIDRAEAEKASKATLIGLFNKA